MNSDERSSWKRDLDFPSRSLDSTVTNLQVELDASGSISLPQFLKVLYRPSPALTLALARALTPTLTLTLTRILALTLTLILTLTLTP